jgi:oxygen-independent coproporphyrinogen-3 oxidase
MTLSSSRVSPPLAAGNVAAGPIRAAYVHIPFCAHKCGYCDFASLAGADHLADRYLDALEREIERVLEGRPAPVETVFVGGGTPTRLTAAQLERLTAMVSSWFPLVSGGEWTVEANPGTLDRDKVEVLVQGGVNRISLGAQSFQRRSLAILERAHDPAEVVRGVELIASRFDRWSLDLIFGVPGSTLNDWKADLSAALALGPSHLSCYGLIFEKGTPLWKRRRRGEVSSVPDELERAMFDHTVETLETAGLSAYEISNHARPGHECRHNLIYWANEPFYGVGLGAAAYRNGERTVNTRDLNAYLARIEAGRSPIGPRERLEPRARAGETAMLMLRRVVLGIDRAEFRLRTGYDLDTLYSDVIAKHLQRGWLEDDGCRVRLTRASWFLSDAVMVDFV